MAKNTLRRNSWRQHGIFIDCINIVLFILIVVASIFLFIDYRKYMLTFPIIFFLAAAMNAAMGLKKYKMDAYSGCIISFIVAIILMGFSVFSLVVVL